MHDFSFMYYKMFIQKSIYKDSLVREIFETHNLRLIDELMSKFPHITFIEVLRTLVMASQIIFIVSIFAVEDIFIPTYQKWGNNNI